jgi:hypothetical protein
LFPYLTSGRRCSNSPIIVKHIHWRWVARRLNARAARPSTAATRRRARCRLSQLDGLFHYILCTGSLSQLKTFLAVRRLRNCIGVARATRVLMCRPPRCGKKRAQKKRRRCTWQILFRVIIPDAARREISLIERDSGQFSNCVV